MASLNGGEGNSGVQGGEGPGAESFLPADGEHAPPHGMTPMSRLANHVEEQMMLQGRVLLVVNHGEDGGLKTPVVFEHDGKASGITHIAVADEFDARGLAERARTVAGEWMREAGADDNADVSIDDVTVHVKLERTLPTVINAVNTRATLRATEKAEEAFMVANGPGSAGTGTCSTSMQIKRLADGGIAATATVTCVIKKEGLSTVEVVAEEHLRVPMLKL